ncbi:EF-hand domain-containing protein [Kordiimonas sp. SCSIO 12603]|uniref:EF-hand domain-containing protein n=1 Tax=Kordiimonas sp. SCSIO 12603 TaxID=2829596 RepID=UPI002105372E|nr:EF-hand domain-containing protein [Kordiimonas sp. SCSIO 12603]UTW60148.1 EF-hand domain-containing protein [Kordiimonas sp. SCSIO 12603]
MTKNSNQTPKKTEFLEVRLPHENKQAFMKACKENGETASGVLREAITLYLENGQLTPEEKPNRRLIMLVTGFIAGAITVGGIFGLTNIVEQEQSPLIEPFFAILDANSNGQISLNEYLATVQPTVRSQKYKHIVGGYLFQFPEFDKLIDERMISEDERKGPGCNILELATAQQTVLFNTLDTDQNNMLSKEEFGKSPTIPSAVDLNTEFSYLDKNADRIISTSEFKVALQEIRKDDFFHSQTLLYSFNYAATCWHPDATEEASVHLAKTNGLMEWTENDNEIKQLFMVADKNNDKSITYQEYLNYFIPSE